MKSSLRTTLALFAAGLLLPVTALTAVAAVDNDTWEGARPAELGQTYSQDTTDADSDDLDAILNGACDFAGTERSVWYAVEATGPEGFTVDGWGTTYSLGLIIFEGEPSVDTAVTCGIMEAAAPTVPGATYYVMAFAANPEFVGDGQLELAFAAAPKAPTMEVSVDERGTAFKDGSARLTGSYSCTDGSEFSGMVGTLTQRVGRLKIVGEFFLSDLVCDGATQAWEAYAASANGYFAGGKAASLTLAYTCGPLECAEGAADYTVQLSRAKK